jgi:hypothetical protein
MRRSRLIFIPVSARLLIGLLFAISSIPLGALAAPASRAGRGFSPTYDLARETTLTGTIQEVVTSPAPGSPAGMHLLVAGPGVVDTHVGPFLSKETKDALQTGAPVQIIGATLSLHGKDYLLARQLTVGARTVTVRNKRGLLVYEPSTRAARSRTEDKGDKIAQRGSQQ